MNPKKYLQQCQGLRGLTFLCIFASHLFRINAWGAWGVSVFLVLSGFLMAYNYLDRTEETHFGIGFACRKLRRLYGLHVLILAGYAAAGLLGFYQGFHGIHDLLSKTVLHTGLIQTWVPYMPYYYSLNDVSWYLCACAFAYACFGPVVRHLRRVMRVGRVWLYVAGIVCLQFCAAAFSYLFLNPDAAGPFSIHWLTYVCPASRFLEFLAGCCLGWLYLNRNRAQNRSAAVWLDITAICATVASWAVYTYRIWPLGIQCMKYAFLFSIPSMLVVYAVSGDGFLNRLLRMRILVRIGDLSPYGFLMHGAMIGVCRYLLALAGITGIWAVTTGSVTLTFVASVLWERLPGRKRGQPWLEEVPGR